MSGKKYKKDEFLKKEVKETQEVFCNDKIRVLCPQHTFIDGNFMLITNRQVENAEDMTAEEMKSLFEVLREIVNCLEKRYTNFVGYNFFVNRGEKAGQHVPHIHFHFIPRYDDEVASPFEIGKNPDKYSLKEKSLEARVLDYKHYFSNCFGTDKFAKKDNLNSDIFSRQAEKNTLGDLIYSDEYFDVIYPLDLKTENQFIFVPKSNIDYPEELNGKETTSLLDILKLITNFLSTNDTNFAGYNLLTSKGNLAGNQHSFVVFSYLARYGNEGTSPLKRINNPKEYDSFELSKEKRDENIKKYKKGLKALG